MSIKGQQLRLHYEDFTIYIITLNRTPQPQECQSRDSNCVYTTRTSPPIYSNFKWTPQPQECQSRDSNCVYTTRTSPSIYSNFKLDTTTTGMSIKGQQLRLHYEDFTTYIITLNRTPQPQECLIKGQQLRLHYEDFTTYIYNFKLDTTTTGMSIKGQQLRLHYEDFTIYI